MNRREIDLELAKINMKKLQMVMTFDREIGWRCVKNESCLKRCNESRDQFQRRLWSTKILKIHRLLLFFIFKYYLGIFQVF